MSIPWRHSTATASVTADAARDAHLSERAATGFSCACILTDPHGQRERQRPPRRQDFLSTQQLLKPSLYLRPNGHVLALDNQPVPAHVNLRHLILTLEPLFAPDCSKDLLQVHIVTDALLQIKQPGRIFH